MALHEIESRLYLDTIKVINRLWMMKDYSKKLPPGVLDEDPYFCLKEIVEFAEKEFDKYGWFGDIDVLHDRLETTYKFCITGQSCQYNVGDDND